MGDERQDRRNVIFTVTTMTALPQKSPQDPRPDVRCIGWFSSIEDAREAVRKNLGDMWEGSYEYAVIETVGEGLYQTDVDFELFRFDVPTMGYKPLEVPEHMKCICGYGIG